MLPRRKHCSSTAAFLHRGSSTDHSTRCGKPYFRLESCSPNEMTSLSSLVYRRPCCHVKTSLFHDNRMRSLMNTTVICYVNYVNIAIEHSQSLQDFRKIKIDAFKCVSTDLTLLLITSAHVVLSTFYLQFN